MTEKDDSAGSSQKFVCPKCYLAEVGLCGIASATDDQINVGARAQVEYHIKRIENGEFADCALPDQRDAAVERGQKYTR